MFKFHKDLINFTPFIVKFLTDNDDDDYVISDDEDMFIRPKKSVNETELVSYLSKEARK